MTPILLVALLAQARPQAPDLPQLVLISDWMVQAHELGDAADFALYASGRVIYRDSARGYVTAQLRPQQVDSMIASLDLRRAFDVQPAFYDAERNVSDATVYTLGWWRNGTPKYVRWRGGLWANSHARTVMPDIYVRWHDDLERFRVGNAKPWHPDSLTVILLPWHDPGCRDPWKDHGWPADLPSLPAALATADTIRWRAPGIYMAVLWKAAAECGPTTVNGRRWSVDFAGEFPGATAWSGR